MTLEKTIPIDQELVNIFGVNDQNLNYLKSLLNVLCNYSLFIWENFQNFRHYFISYNISVFKF